MFHKPAETETPAEAAPAQRPYGAPSYTPPATKQVPVPAQAEQAPEKAQDSSESKTCGSASVSEGPRLVVGRGINFSGQIEACSHLIVEGTVEAALDGAQTLDVAESGTFYGSISIEEAVIAGRFEGDLAVNGLLRITSTGAITGSVAYKSLEVEPGALIEGRIGPLSEKSAAPAQKQKPAPKPAARVATPAPAPANAESAPEGGNQLFAATVAG